MGCGASSAEKTSVYAMQMKGSGEDISPEIVLEHYQPHEFPIRPILTVRTQALVKESWDIIKNTTYDSDKTQSDKISGVSHFYNVFFDQLILRFKDFERIFPTISSRADTISKVMALCTSVRVDELDLVKARLRSLGAKHVSIVHDPWLFGIYATTVLNAIRICLQDKATQEIMTSWLHLLAFVLRNMLPDYFKRSGPFMKLHEGVICAASTLSKDDCTELQTMAKNEKSIQRIKSRTGVGKTSAISGPASRTSFASAAEHEAYRDDTPVVDDIV